MSRCGTQMRSCSNFNNIVYRRRFRRRLVAPINQSRQHHFEFLGPKLLFNDYIKCKLAE